MSDHDAASSPSPSSSPVGVVGSYRLLEPLGSGGMSSVFRAVHIDSGHVVALKVLPKVLARKSTLLQRFLREAKSAESLEHPNIVAIYDRGVDDGRHYLVLEYVDGKDLHDLVQDEGPLAPERAVSVVRQAAEALRHAAARGTIHRDVKPANLLLGRDGRVKIIDLGLALQAEDEDERVTRDGTTVGTVDYMAPEQARDSRATGIHSDIYSLGCTLFYLLTGSPPYPGGDIADKLRRHASVPPPDARQYRADVPESLSRLVRRMMAKRAERRFPDYEELIAELDSLKLGPPASDETAIRPSPIAEAPPTLAPAPAPPVALIAEDDEDDDLVPLTPIAPVAPAAPLVGAAPPVALIDDGPPDEIALMPEDGPLLAPPRPRSEVVPPVALIADDDDEDDKAPPPRPKPVARPASGPRSAVTPAPRTGQSAQAARRSAPEVRMADLAALQEDAGPPPTRPRSSSQVVRAVGPPARPASVDEALFEANAPAISPALVPSGGSDDWKAVRGWVYGGLAGAVIVIVSLMALRAALAPPQPRDGDLGPAAEGGAPDVPPAPAVIKPGPDRPKAPTAAPPAPPAAPTAWVEPEEDTRALGPEPPFPATWETRFARPPVAPPGGPIVAVRRAGPVEGRGEVVTTLSAGLEGPGALIEVADNGPFFEADLKVGGRDRWVRARSGYRPIVFIEPPRRDDLKDQFASLLVPGSNLTLEGIDLVVKVGLLDPAQTALLGVRGGSLTLRDCTITVLGASGRPYTIIDADGPSDPKAPRRARVVLERTFVRGAAMSIFKVGPGTEVLVERSALVASGGAMVAAAGAGPPRQVQLARTLAASTGPFVELGGARPTSGEPAVKVTLLGATIARLDGGAAPAPFLMREEASGPLLIDVQGAFTTFAGWTSWLVTGKTTTRLADDSAAREAWPAFEGPRLDGGPWKLGGPAELVAASDLAAIAPACQPIVDRLPAPSATLIEKTVEAYRRPAVPDLAAGPGGWWLPTAANAPASAVLDLTFDVQATPWKGDLGHFLRDSVPPTARLVRVLARGMGPHEMGLVRLPPGTSLEVRVEPPPGAPATVGGKKVEPLTWSPRADARGEALFDVRSGHLAMSQVRLTRKGTTGPEHLVRVEDGHLIMNRCVLSAAEGGGGRPLVVFRAASTRDLPARPPINLPSWDRSTCRLIDTRLHAAGEALGAELGRGLVALTHCVVTSEGTGFTLRPEKVRRDRFAADLWLDRCTVVAGRSIVGFGKWPGADPGPERPWLVSTKHCAFLDAFQRGNAPRQGAMLRLGDPEGLARGAVAWQSTGDAYDVSRYIVAGAAPPDTRDDFKTRWGQVWGSTHAFGATAPARGDSAAIVRLAGDRLKPGEFQPGDLAVIAPAQIGADVGRLGITSTRKP